MPPARHEAGFTLFETLIAIGLGMTMTAVFTSTFATSSGLWGRSTVALRVHEEHRRNLDAVGNAFRGAAASTFTGFDVNNNSTQPACQCVIGIDENGVVLDEVRTVSWRATTIPAEGVSSPGELILTQDGTTRVIARNVPAGGFRATLLGNSLRLTMTTYSTGTNHQLSMLTSDTALALRN